MPADLDDLVALMVAYCDFYATRPGPVALRGLAEALLADPQRHGRQLIARDANGSAAGFATLYWSWSSTRAAPIAVMNDLYVVDGQRGRGLAEQLIARGAEEARAHGAAVMEWQTAPDNHRAQRVYDRVGAQRSQWLTYELDITR